MRMFLPMFMDEVLRVEVRLERAPVQYGNKDLVIFPNNSSLTDFFIHRRHLQFVHSGVDTHGLHYVNSIVSLSVQLFVVPSKIGFYARKGALLCTS